MESTMLPMFPLLFLSVWIGVSFIISVVGGWTTLSRKYRCTSTMASWKGWQSANIGGVSYNHCLWLAAEPEGLYLKTGPAFFFRAFHPPLMIPWQAIKEVQQKTIWGIRLVELRVEPQVTIRFMPQSLSSAKRFLGDKLP